jgi:hypothetical protein
VKSCAIDIHGAGLQACRPGIEPPSKADTTEGARQCRSKTSVVSGFSRAALKGCATVTGEELRD